MIAKIKKLRPERLVIDTLRELRLLARDPFGYRRQVLALKRFFSAQEATVLALDDHTDAAPDQQLHSIVHGVISLEQRRMTYGVVRRQLSVGKLRGVDFRSGYHDYVIQSSRARSPMTSTISLR